jgi:cytoskeleton protein RodZ
MNVATVGPGARLKLERERRGLSLQKAADEMRLDTWVIEALEAEQYERVGPSVYGKGHLKKYASILGISWDDIASGYELRASPTEAPPPPTSMRVPTSVPRGDHLPRGQVAAIVLLLLVIAGVLWWKPWQPRLPVGATNSAAGADAAGAGAGAAGASGAGAAGVSAAGTVGDATGLTAPDMAKASHAAQTAAGLPDAAPSGQAPLASAASVNGGAAADRPGVPSKAAPVNGSPLATPTAATADAIPGHGAASLRLSFSAESWVDVRDVNGKRIYSGYGHANSVKTIAGDGPLRVYLGYARGVQVDINDHAVAIGTQFVHGDVARFQAGADGILRSFSGGERPRG